MKWMSCLEAYLKRVFQYFQATQTGLSEYLDGPRPHFAHLWFILLKIVRYCGQNTVQACSQLYFGHCYETIFIDLNDIQHIGNLIIKMKVCELFTLKRQEIAPTLQKCPVQGSTFRCTTAAISKLFRWWPPVHNNNHTTALAYIHPVHCLLLRHLLKSLQKLSVAPTLHTTALEHWISFSFSPIIPCRWWPWGYPLLPLCGSYPHLAQSSLVDGNHEVSPSSPPPPHIKSINTANHI